MMISFQLMLHAEMRRPRKNQSRPILVPSTPRFNVTFAWFFKLGVALAGTQKFEKKMGKRLNDFGHQ
jgi:hypothetical protein